MSKVILDLCGGTGAWSKPYRDNGYDVRLITLPEYDVRTYKPPDNVYGVLAAPPCNHFSIAGACRWKTKGEKVLIEALSIVDACIRIISVTNPVFWALENPIGRLKHYLGKPLMYWQPYDYGDPWSKKTCLWGKFNIPLKSSVKPQSNFVLHSKLSQPISPAQIRMLLDMKYLPNNYKDLYGEKLDRAMIRAITPAGFANAFHKANK